jgi:two-component system NtrC family sensor kinase
LLIVDDQAAIRELAAAILTADGHHVTTAPDGAEALRLLEGPAPYDLIVSDLKMPNLDRPSLYLEVSRRWPDGRPHVLFMSRFVDSPQYAGFLEAAKVPVLLKPFDIDQLCRLVHDILHQS